MRPNPERRSEPGSLTRVLQHEGLQPPSRLCGALRPPGLVSRMIWAVAALVLLVLVPLEGGAQTAPTAEITWDQEAAYTAETFDLTFTFSEEVSGFTADDLHMQDGTVETFPAVSQGTVFVITIRPDRSEEQIIVVLLTESVTGVISSEKNRQKGVSISLSRPPRLTNREALEALYDATDGPNWTTSTNWKSAEPLNTWYSVTTDADGNVTHLYLNDIALSGEIPPELGDLRHLTFLDLSGNTLSGEIPPELGDLIRLTRLHLNRNTLSGEIPPELGDLTRLTQLHLDMNTLSGEIPPELENLAQLTHLYLRFNTLSGAIPAELGNLANLYQLYLHDNTLSGAIPKELGNLANLQTLNLSGNTLSGAIPTVLEDLAKLRVLELHNNTLSGAIPAELGNLANLLHLKLSGNTLSGAIPTVLGDLAKLRILYLANNALSGEIPTELGDLDLWDLRLHNNALSGEIPTELWNFTDIDHLYLHGNALSGEIPTELGTSDFTYLVDLKLHSNAALSGALPASFPDRLTVLTELQIQNTQVTVPSDAAFTTWLGDITLTTGERTSSATVDLALGTTDPRGLWSDGTTVWVLGSDAMLYAYQLATGGRVANRDIDVAVPHLDPYGLWSDGETLWVAYDGFNEHDDEKLYAYELTTGTRVPARDIELLPGNDGPRGLWSDGTTLWMTDTNDPNTDPVYAFDLATGTRDMSKEIALAGTNKHPRGLWSDGTTLWVADSQDAWLYAYDLATGDWDPAKDALLAPTNLAPWGLWSNGTTWWVADASDGKVYRYGPALPVANAQIAVSFDKDTYPTQEGPNTSAAIDVILSEAPSSAVTISVQLKPAPNNTTTDPNDYQETLPLELDFAVGEISKGFEITPVDDDLVEAPEILELTFGDLPMGFEEGTRSVAQVTIQDNDSPPDAQIAVSFDKDTHPTQEGPNTSAAIDVILSEAPSSAVTISVQLKPAPNNTTTDPNDYQETLPLELDFAVGEISKGFEITPVDDDLVEGPEILELTFGDLPMGFEEGTRSVAQVTIHDNDSPPDAPRNLKAEAGNGTVTLTWAAPADIRSPITKYQYRQSIDNGNTWDPDWNDIPGIDPSQFTSSYTIGSLTNGTAYTYEVRAWDKNREGTASNQVSATPAGPRPPVVPRPPVTGGSSGGGSSSGGGGGGSRDAHSNSPAGATVIGPSSTTAGTIAPAGDVDYFTFPASQAGLVFVETTGSTNTVGTLWQGGEELGQATLGGSGQDDRLGVPVQAGPVVVAVAGQGRATGAYRLVVTFVAGYLENPGANSFQSGIGVLSGWVCEAGVVEIELNGVPQEAAYGTERLDTAGVCGNTDNGFGLLFNWNLLGEGEHKVVAFVDGIELDRATVTVTTLGMEFVRDVTGTCEAEDFPTLGETVTLEWQQTSQNFVIAEGAAPAGVNRAGIAGVGYLENPGANSFQSGIGVISGWVCAADAVEIAIGDLALQGAGYGTERLDTEDVCGDTANGFGLLFNWNLLGEGEYEVVAYVDDEELGRATVRVTTVGEGAEEEFLRGAEGECVVEDFPMPGETVTLEWQQNSQNFVMTQVE